MSIVAAMPRLEDFMIFNVIQTQGLRMSLVSSPPDPQPRHFGKNSALRRALNFNMNVRVYNPATWYKGFRC
jgi:hypothetical protein